MIRRAVSAAALAAMLTLGACGGGQSPFGDSSKADDAKVPDAAPATPSAEGASAGTAAPSPTTAATSPPEGDTLDTNAQPPLPSNPGSAPAPDGDTQAVGSARGPKPKTRQARIEADKTAKLNVRTMVSVIEGCHSGRTSYRDCNTHAELGAPSIIGVEIGRRPGQVQITATKNGFRMTGYSLSGAKFTVARGPNGDRFKCIPGPQPGACPQDRTWSW